jgi:hypothetical protein
MDMTTWDALTRAYPALATEVAGSAPLKFAVTEWSEGRCATVITPRDLIMDACEEAK